MRLNKLRLLLLKLNMNPYHDEKGRFSTGSGAISYSTKEECYSALKQSVSNDVVDVLTNSSTNWENLNSHEKEVISNFYKETEKIRDSLFEISGEDKTKANDILKEWVSGTIDFDFRDLAVDKISKIDKEISQMTFDEMSEKKKTIKAYRIQSESIMNPSAASSFSLSKQFIKNAGGYDQNYVFEQTVTKDNLVLTPNVVQAGYGYDSISNQAEIVLSNDKQLDSIDYSNFNRLERILKNMNPYHEPAGTSKGGQFASKDISGLSYTERAFNGPELIKKTLKYLVKNYPELITDRERLKQNLEYRPRLSNENEDEFIEKAITAEIDYYGDEYTTGNRQTEEWLPQAFDGASPFLYGLISYVKGSAEYGRGSDGRIEFDKKYGISDFIDSHQDVHYTQDKPLFRGLTTTPSQFKQMKVGETIDMMGPSSWTENERVANRFLNTSTNKSGNKRVVFKDVTKGERNAMIYPFSSTDNEEASKRFYGGTNNQEEVLYSGSARFTIKKIEETKDIFGNEAYYVEVEEK